MAEGEGFEPSKPFDLRAFQARSFDHSDTPPQIVVPSGGVDHVRQNGAHTIELSAVLQAIFRFGGESLEYRVAALSFHAEGVTAVDALHEGNAPSPFLRQRGLQPVNAVRFERETLHVIVRGDGGKKTLLAFGDHHVLRPAPGA